MWGGPSNRLYGLRMAPPPFASAQGTAKVHALALIQGPKLGDVPRVSLTGRKVQYLGTWYFLIMILLPSVYPSKYNLM